LGDGDSAVEVRLRQDNDEFLAAVTGEQLLLAHARLDAGRQLAEHEIAAEVAHLVVDRLEAVEVEHDDGQRPAVALRARQLPVEELQQITLVVDLGQSVDDGEAVDLLVIFGLDVAAGEEAIDAIADTKIVAVLELANGGGHVVDEGAV